MEAYSLAKRHMDTVKSTPKIPLIYVFLFDFIGFSARTGNISHKSSDEA
jgi:hypothetical protein